MLSKNVGSTEPLLTLKKIVAIDGCQTARARKTIENAGLKVTDWICVTDEGTTKNHRLLLEQEEIELITQRARERLKGIQSR